ncbi:MAG TPA: NF038122 family metalloprotease [Blastocatellia bacterium]|nr:NF038122 family metalloprotease [Blastocatellia bacterium]
MNRHTGHAALSVRQMLLLITLGCLLASSLAGVIFQQSSAAQDDSLRLNPKHSHSSQNSISQDSKSKGRMIDTALPSTDDLSNQLFASPYASGFVIESDGTQTICRDASAEEARAMRERNPQQQLRQLNHEESADFSQGQAQNGMKIILRGTSQLEQFPAAKAAFIRAAQRWEAVIQSPITVIIDVDYGPARFGETFPPNIIGSTDSQDIGGNIYPAVRSALISHASNAQEAALYNALPQGQLPTDIGTTTGIFNPTSVFRAVGILNPVANPDGESQQFGPPPSIGFNSAFQFDFDPDNGIDPGKTDFDATAVHEIGHALGFTSNAGLKELVPTSPIYSCFWDLFRFRPGVTSATFSSAQRILSSGGEQVFFGGAPELALSTGRPDGNGGDGRQSSHWKDDELIGRYIGIMDPTLSSGRREEITENDLKALDIIGYQVRTGSTPTPTPTPGGDTVALSTGTPKTGSVPAPPSGSATMGATQYTIQVPSGATQLKVELSGNQDVDLFVRFGSRIVVQNGGPVADFKSETESNNESVTVTPGSNPALQVGVYYIAIGNYGPGAASFTITATVIGGGGPTPTPTPGGNTVAMSSGVPQTGSIPASQQSGGGILGEPQYSIQASSGASQLKVNLSGNQDVDLYIRLGNRIGIQNGALIADFKSESETGNETITITSASSPALQAGVYYIGIVNWGSGTASFSVTASVSGGGGPTPTPTPGPTPGGNRVVRVGQTGGSPGGQVGVPVELVAQGDETALGFSLTFDPAVLNNPQAALGNDAAGATLNANTGQVGSGRLGIALSLPSGQKFNAGTRQIVVVTFAIAAGAAGSSTPVGFADQPITREVSDTNARALPASYTPGAVAVTTGFEGDVAPRPNGNGLVTITDWVQIGRFVSGQDAPSASEFQRADIAPRDTRGNGSLTVTDWVQAGRYSAGLDAPTPAGGPGSQGGGFAATFTRYAQPNAASGLRTVHISNGYFGRGQQSSVIIELGAEGNENALGFSLNFNPAQLRFVSATIGKDATGATLNINTSLIAKGSLGVALALPAGQTLVAGQRQIIVINFAVTSEDQAMATTINFGDQPVTRELSDANANSLPVSFTGSTVTLTHSVTSVSAASFTGQSLASEAIVAAFGQNLAMQFAVAESLPLPTTLAGTTVRVRDSAGIERLAPLFFVAPSQINYQIPAGTAAGEAMVTITSGESFVSTGVIHIAAVAPGFFSAASNGQGAAAAVALRIKANGVQSYEPVARYDAAQNRFIAFPIDLGEESDQVYLILFGTGFRHQRDLSNVVVKLDDVETAVLFAGPQGEFEGLDQLNLRIPRNLAGRGEVEVIVNMGGYEANRVRIHLK